MPLLYFERSQADRKKKMNLDQELPLRERAASPSKPVMMREDLRICKSGVKNHPTGPMEAGAGGS